MSYMLNSRVTFMRNAQITNFYLPPVKQENDCDTDEEGTCHFMVNVIQPQFNLHSEEAKVSMFLNALYL